MIIDMEDKTFNINLNKKCVLMISGVPGVGKTTISYEILKRCDDFRIIQETDLIREILRGYNAFLFDNLDVLDEKILRIIPDHKKIFNYVELIEQSRIIKNSIEMIIIRQQRKGIPTIINGVHIVPEVLNGVANNESIVYVNLFIDKKDTLKKRWEERDAQKYADFLDVAFETNLSLKKSTSKLSKQMPKVFLNLNITNLTIDQTVEIIMQFIINSFTA